MENRIIGSNSHGNKNEINIVEALNNKTFSTLNNNLKEFIKYIAEDRKIKLNLDTKINAKYETSTKLKQDFYVYIEEDEFAISCKMGSGNSVHQEKCSDFIKYIKEKLNANEDVCNDICLFLWADGTLDGSGPSDKDEKGDIICRFTSKEFRNKYPEKAENIQDFLDKNKRILIDRFLFIGRHNSRVDYIYHGNEINGRWISSEEIIKINMKADNNNTIHVGKMSLQSWNVSKKGTSEQKRGQLQVKYSQMKNDIFELMKINTKNVNTFMGDKEEFDISNRFNKNKKSSIWKYLTEEIDDLENVFMVKISDRVLSHLSNKKVYPKADAYLIRANITQDFLLQKEYELTENDLKDINYEIIKNSGISVKIDGSNNYTIQKLTHESFLKAFSGILDNTEFIFMGLLLYSNEKEKNKNQMIIKKLNIDEEKFKIYFNEKLDKQIDYDNINDLNEIRKFSQNYLKKQIMSNKKIYSSLFTGFDWFDEPYVAHYIYLNKVLNKNELSDFSITTGSGRSKGQFSIEIKPI